jgi:hypothetical protein
MYWAEACQTKGLQAIFAPIAKELEENEQQF